MTKWWKLAASSIALLALAGCSIAEPPAPTFTATPSTTPTPTTVASDGPTITGDIGADVLAAGFKPDNMDSAVDWIEDSLCDASHEDGIGGTEFDRHVRTTGGLEDGRIHPDAMRVVVDYKCPQLSEALEVSIADAQDRFWG